MLWSNVNLRGSMFRKRRSADDFAREIQAHLDLETQRLIDEGMRPDDARMAAQRAFGNVVSAMERFHEARGLMWLDYLAADARASLRSLAKYPVACAVAVVSLAGGIGATTATLAVRDAVFRKPPALYHAPEQLSRIQVGTPERPIRPLGNLVPGRLLQIWRDNPDGPAIAAAASAGTREVRTDDRTHTVPIRSVTPEFFAVLGVRAALGQTFSEVPPERWAAPAAVLSDGTWRLLFDGRADVAGRVVWIDNRPHTVVGVMPPRFWFTSMDAPIWIPLEPSALSSVAGLDVVIRRPPEMTPQRLAGLLEHGLRDYASRLPNSERKMHLGVSGIEGTPLGRSVALALPWLLGASVLLTLLIACANVAILVIAQWTAREHEIAIRAALGGSRSRIVRLLLTESLLIATAGGLLGVCATVALVTVIRRGAGPLVGFFDLSIDSGILLQSIIVTAFTGVVAGLGPALFETRRLHGNPMRSLSSSDRVRQRWRNALVGVEIAVTVALLVVAATMIDGYRRSVNADLGFSPRHLIAVRVEHGSGVDVARVVDVLTAMPGIVNAAASTTVPYAEFGGLQRVAPERSGANTVTAERGAIDPAFFTTLGVAIRAGRVFSEQESTTARVAIVNEMLAERLWPRGSPLGRSVWIGETPYEVIGVVADYRNSAFQSPNWAPKLYLPFDRRTSELKSVRFLVRCADNAPTVVRALRREIATEAPGHVVSRAFTIDEMIAIGGQEILVGTAPLVPLIAIGMLLTAAGIYGVLAFAVTRRSKELAVRVAIGATGHDLVRLVAAHSVLLVAIGTAAGVGGTFALARVVRASGGAGGMFDPEWPAFILPALVIVLVGAFASWIPSRRALKIDPAVLLRLT